MMAKPETEVKAEITLIIKTTSIKKAEQLRQIAELKGDVELQLPNRKGGSGKENTTFVPTLTLLAEKYGSEPFKLADALKLVQSTLGFSSTNLRSNLQTAVDNGKAKRVKTGFYALIMPAIHEEEIGETIPAPQ